MAHESKSITLVPVGLYVNIALAVRKEPRIVKRVKSVIGMGGRYTRGNITPAAKFNIVPIWRQPTWCSGPIGTRQWWVSTSHIRRWPPKGFRPRAGLWRPG
jgi:hypothetical protein